MNINIVCVGKIKENFYKDAIAEYAKRMGRFGAFKVVEVEEYLSQDNDIERVKREEGARILAKTRGIVVALDRLGAMADSEQIASFVQDAAVNGKSVISFVIGGSHGLSAEVIKSADWVLSFGKVTYPHQLMRVILSEQIYRAFMINANNQYHK